MSTTTCSCTATIDPAHSFLRVLCWTHTALHTHRIHGGVEFTRAVLSAIPPHPLRRRRRRWGPAMLQHTLRCLPTLFGARTRTPCHGKRTRPSCARAQPPMFVEPKSSSMPCLRVGECTTFDIKTVFVLRCAGASLEGSHYNDDATQRHTTVVIDERSDEQQPCASQRGISAECDGAEPRCREGVAAICCMAFPVSICAMPLHFHSRLCKTIGDRTDADATVPA